jgi:hypothetical protein
MISRFHAQQAIEYGIYPQIFIRDPIINKGQVQTSLVERIQRKLDKNTWVDLSSQLCEKLGKRLAQMHLQSLFRMFGQYQNMQSSNNKVDLPLLQRVLKKLLRLRCHWLSVLPKESHNMTWFASPTC